jgi:glycosyltransferase involved in cell wall biosynthesis
MIKISAIITTFNSEKTIRRTLDSVFHQNGYNELFKMEIIAVDDCSSDNTVEILKKYPIYLFTTEKNSGGPNRGRNIGLQKSTGDWITIMDHDDVWHEDRIISLLPHLDKAPIISCGYTSIDHTKDEKRKVIPKCLNSTHEINEYESNSTFINKLTRSKKGQSTYLGSLVFSSKLKSHGFEEVYGQVDYDWILRLFEKNKSTEICKSLFDRHVWENNLSLNETYRKNDYKHSVSFIQKSYASIYPSEAKLGLKRVNGSMARYYYRMEDMAKAREYLKKTDFCFKTILYYLSSFMGYKWVNKKFNVFG